MSIGVISRAETTEIRSCKWGRCTWNLILSHLALDLVNPWFWGYVTSIAQYIVHFRPLNSTPHNLFDECLTLWCNTLHHGLIWLLQINFCFFYIFCTCHLLHASHLTSCM